MFSKLKKSILFCVGSVGSDVSDPVGRSFTSARTSLDGQLSSIDPALMVGSKEKYASLSNDGICLKDDERKTIRRQCSYRGRKLPESGDRFANLFLGLLTHACPMDELLRKKQAISPTQLPMHFRFPGTISPAGSSAGYGIRLCRRGANGMMSTGFSVVSFQRPAWS